ncbi:uncharacterized protein DC041_0004130, partial [Schistosoma bovis]
PSGISKTTLSNYELCVLTGALKSFIRQLETPIMTFQLHDSFMSAMNSILDRSENMFTSSSNENYSSQTSLQSIKSSSTFTSSFTTTSTTTKSNSQSFKSSPSLPIALQIVHDNEYITNQHEQNSTNDKILNHSLHHHHNSLLVTSPLSIHHNNHLIEPSLRSRISPQRSSPNPPIHLVVSQSFRKSPAPPPPVTSAKCVNTIPVRSSSTKPITLSQTSVTTTIKETATTAVSALNHEDLSSHNHSDKCNNFGVESDQTCIPHMSSE